MSDRYDLANAYIYGFDDGYDEYGNDNPYSRDNRHASDLWEAYEKGYREGLAERERVGDAEAERCPKCGGTVGHRINCPDGMAFSRPAS